MTLLEDVRCLLSNAKLFKQLWGEVVQSTSYLVNKSPVSAIYSKTHDDVWFEKETRYSHFKVFGLYILVREARSKKFIFLRYPKEVKGYKLCCPLRRKIVISHDVVFNELETI